MDSLDIRTLDPISISYSSMRIKKYHIMSMEFEIQLGLGFEGFI